MPSFCLDRKSTRLNSSHLVILVSRLLLGSEEHTSELQSPCNLVCRLLLEKKNTAPDGVIHHTRIKIGDSHMALGAAHGPNPPMTSISYLYVPNVDAVYLLSLFFFLKTGKQPGSPPFPDRPLSG